jgi:hypothetical protein
MIEIIKSIIQDHPNQISAITASCALLVSFLSIVLTVWTLRVQRRHNFLSVTPIASIPINDYEDNIAVKVKNTGVGPLLIETFRATDGHEEKDDLISWMPSLPTGMYWSTFYDDIDGLCIPPGDEAVLLRLQGDPNDTRFIEARDSTRRALSALIVTVTYKDIYSRRMSSKTRNLSWFGRHFREQTAAQRLAADGL